MSNETIIRPAQINDFDIIQNQFHKMFLIYDKDQDTNYPYTSDGVEYINSRISNGFCFIAILDSKIIGFITGSIDTAISFKTYDKYGLIENLFVHENYRNRGTGKLLIRSLIEHFRESDIKNILTDSDDKPPLKAFFKSIGFEITGINYELKI